MRNKFKKGNHPETEFKKGCIPHNKGKNKDNYEPLKKTSDKLKNKSKSEEHRKKLLGSHGGKQNTINRKRIPESTRRKHSGSNCHFWKGGKTALVKVIRTCFEYKQWRSAVFERDNWTCQTCQKRGCYIESHHKKELSKIIEEFNIKTIEDAKNCKELWDTNNGVTLCEDCHNLTKKGNQRRRWFLKK